MKFWPLILVVITLIGGCASQQITPADVTGPETWGASDNVTHVRHLYFSEQPDAEALRTAKLNGVTTVINLRDPSESDWDEEDAVESLGLNYINIPIRKQSETFSPTAIAAINAAVEAQNGQPVLLHCSSGNRAAGWLAIHLVEGHKLSNENAIAVAREAGLSSDVIAKRVTTYIESGSQ